jgi:uncharacterized protein YnzC (UPF0291/DUF896 family)
VRYMNIPQFMNRIPVNGKTPLVAWKEFTEREQTKEEKEKLNQEFPKAGRGIITGKVSGIIVVDDDGGLDTSTHKIPATLSQSTPRGGKHYFFRWAEELEKKITTKVGLMPKVDVRGDGGFVCFYGFDKPFGSVPLARPPQWLVDLLSSREQPQPEELKKAPWVLEQLENIQPGQGTHGRTPTFVRVINQLKARGLGEAEIVGLLDPWAVKYEYTHSMEKLVGDQFRRYPPNVSITNDAPSSSIDSFLEDEEKIEWIAEGMVAKGTIGFVAGLPETGKTWILIDLAVEVARGGIWLGKFPVKQGKVLFVDQERFKGETQRRFRAVLTAKGCSPKDLNQDLFVRCGTTTRINLQHSFEAFKKELSSVMPSLVIIDSFATFHTHEENNRQSIQEVLEKVKELRTEFGCTFLFIAHENKLAFQKEEDAGGPSIAQMSGNIAIPAVAETVFTVRKQDSESSMVYNTKNTLAPSVAPFLVMVTDVNEEKTSITVKGY